MYDEYHSLGVLFGTEVISTCPFPCKTVKYSCIPINISWVRLQLFANFEKCQCLRDFASLALNPRSPLSAKKFL